LLIMNTENLPHIDADFPGGNIVVESVRDQEVAVHQDLRDTEGDWFYWYFRVRGAAGRSLRFEFTQSRAIGVRGPALSRNQGRSWQWLGSDCVEDNGFSYAFPADADEVRFSFAMPYLAEDFETFLSDHAESALLRREVLCHSTHGREVDLLRVGQCDGDPSCRVLVTCRHHCCEMMASYVLEGLLEAVLAGEPGAGWLAENAEIVAVPFVDKDGVEEGDQGKYRRPRDHNRDYVGESIYPETKALRELVEGGSLSKLRVGLDLHCPHVSGELNQKIYLVGLPDEANWEEQQRFGAMLESSIRGPLPYRAENNLPFGEGWNTHKSYEEGMSFARWAADHGGVIMASTIETPYADAGGEEVNQQTARKFGVDLARALAEYLPTGE
jgi:hypothetical protein